MKNKIGLCVVREDILPFQNLAASNEKCFSH